MKLLILGAAGQVGRELSVRANPQWQIVALDRKGLDITNGTAVEDFVTQYRPDVIINAAAYTAVDKAESEVSVAFAINCNGAGNLAQAAHKTGAALLHISTDYVFPGDKEGVYREEDSTGPGGVYGASKLAGEKAIVAHCPRHIILRTSWVFGEFGNNFVKTMIRLSKDRDCLSVVGDQHGSPTWAGDIAEALLQIAQKIVDKAPVQWGIYHFSGFPYTTWAKFADEILTRAAAQGQIEKKPAIKAITTEEYPTPAVRPPNSQLNCDKIFHNFQIMPSDWRSALSDLVAYCSKV